MAGEIWDWAIPPEVRLGWRVFSLAFWDLRLLSRSFSSGIWPSGSSLCLITFSSSTVFGFLAVSRLRCSVLALSCSLSISHSCSLRLCSPLSCLFLSNSLSASRWSFLCCSILSPLLTPFAGRLASQDWPSDK